MLMNLYCWTALHFLFLFHGKAFLSFPGWWAASMIEEMLLMVREAIQAFLGRIWRGRGSLDVCGVTFGSEMMRGSWIYKCVW